MLFVLLLLEINGSFFLSIRGLPFLTCCCGNSRHVANGNSYLTVGAANRVMERFSLFRSWSPFYWWNTIQCWDVLDLCWTPILSYKALSRSKAWVRAGFCTIVRIQSTSALLEFLYRCWFLQSKFILLITHFHVSIINILLIKPSFLMLIHLTKPLTRTIIYIALICRMWFLVLEVVAGDPVLGWFVAFSNTPSLHSSFIRVCLGDKL